MFSAACLENNVCAIMHCTVFSSCLTLVTKTNKNHPKQYLRNEIATLTPGMRLVLHWKEYWNGLEVCGSVSVRLQARQTDARRRQYHRIDPEQPNQNFLNRLIPIIFADCDDRQVPTLRAATSCDSTR